MKKVIALLLVILAVGICITSCSKYTSSYSSTILITTDRSDKGSMEFASFKGTKVFKLKNNGNGILKYEGELKSGTMDVFYDSDGTKKKLFTINGGDESISDTLEFEGDYIYVICECDETCDDGKLAFKTK